MLMFVKFISLFSDDDDDDDGAMMLVDYVHLFDDYDVDHAAHDDDGDQVGDEVDDDYDCVPQFLR